VQSAAVRHELLGSRLGLVMPDFEGKTIVVMGGTSGIGCETALAFFRARAKVIASCLETE